MSGARTAGDQTGDRTTRRRNGNFEKLPSEGPMMRRKAQAKENAGLGHLFSRLQVVPPPSGLPRCLNYIEWASRARNRSPPQLHRKGILVWSLPKLGHDPGHALGAKADGDAVYIDVDALGQQLNDPGSSAGNANVRVAESLYRRATGEGREAVTAAIFWLETRARTAPIGQCKSRTSGAFWPERVRRSPKTFYRREQRAASARLTRRETKDCGVTQGTTIPAFGLEGSTATSPSSEPPRQ